MFHLCLHFSRSQSINQITSALWPAHSADRAFPGQENSRAYVVTASCNGRLPIVSESISPLPTLPSDCLQFDFVRKAGLASEDNLCLIRMIFDFARFGCKFGMRPVRRIGGADIRPACKDQKFGRFMISTFCFSSLERFESNLVRLSHICKHTNTPESTTPALTPH